MRSRLYGNIARQVAMGRGALRAISRSQVAAPPGKAGARNLGKRKDRPLPYSTAVPLWGVLSILGWLVAAHVTMGLMSDDDRRQLASPSSPAPLDADLVNFITAAGAAQP